MATERLCSIPECGKPHFGRGYCRNHHYRLWKHGSPVAGRTSNGEPRAFYNFAAEYDGDECLIWPYYRSSSGYGQIQSGGRPLTVSRLLCEEFNGPPPSPAHHAAHSCGNGRYGCVTKSHLSWKTPKDNNADKILHGTDNRGERNNMSKLTSEQAREILSLKGKETQTFIARRYGVSQAHVSRIHLGQSWGWFKETDSGLAKQREAG